MRMIHSSTARAFVLLVAVIVAWAARPVTADAHGRSHDPLAQLEQQKRRAEQRKTKRREELDVQGAETRDAKKAAEDSRQNSRLKDGGQPNPQTNRWGDVF